MREKPWGHVVWASGSWVVGVVGHIHSGGSASTRSTTAPSRRRLRVDAGPSARRDGSEHRRLLALGPQDHLFRAIISRRPPLLSSKMGYCLCFRARWVIVSAFEQDGFHLARFITFLRPPWFFGLQDLSLVGLNDCKSIDSRRHRPCVPRLHRLLARVYHYRCQV